MKRKFGIAKALALLLALCMALSLVYVTAFADEINFIPQGVTYSTDIKVTYHTQVNVTANVSVKDSNGAVVETKQVTKSSEEFLEGGVGALQAKLTALQAEIEKPYQASGTVTRGGGAPQTIVDHFESASFYTFTPASGDPVEFSTDLDAAKQYFEKNPNATGTFTNFLDMHQYQKYNYTYDLTVQQTATVIDVVEINGVTVSFKDGDKPVFTGKVPEGAGYAFRCEWWSMDENTGIVSTEPEWGGDIYKNKITAFEAGKTYHYGVYVTAYTADISPDAKLKINGQEVSYTRIGSDDDTQSFWVLTDLTMTPAAQSGGSTTPGGNAPATGDSSHSALYAALLLVSGSMLAGAAAFRRRKHVR